MLPRIGRMWVLAVLSVPWLTTSARAQGILVDGRANVAIGRSYEVREVRVDARVRDQVAEVQVSQTFHNPGSFVLESEYFFPLPEEGAIQNFVLLVDGREFPGKVLPKDEARRIYEGIVRSKRDPALLEYMGRGLFRTSVFPIPPGADRKVTLRYTQLCKRDRDVVEFSYPFSTQKFTAKPIERLNLTLDLQSREPIKSIYSPTSDASVSRGGDHDARVGLEQRNIIPSQDFRLVYTLAEGSLGATVLSYRPSSSEDGYFLLLASPRIRAADERPRPRTILFVLDRSGSMAGKKIEQARKSLQFVLNNLHDDDLFNIIAYDDRVETFRPELQRYSSKVRAEAERYVENLREGGATNINEALKTALGMIQDDTRPGYVLFLTDGLPTAGETGELKIAQSCREANRHHARVFSFGLGFDVNARLLDRISGGNAGTSEYVKPDEDIETHVGRFYAKLTSPALNDIRVELSGIDVNRTYPRDIPDLFDGGQLIWVGRYRQGGRTSVRLSGKVAAERRSFDFDAELASADRGTSYDFVERIWAIRRVGDIIDQVDLHGQNRELVDELVALSTRYGILTPYTSFLADDRVELHASRENASLARDSLNELERVSGAGAVAQRSVKQRYLEASKPESSLSVAAERSDEEQKRNPGLPPNFARATVAAARLGKPAMQPRGAAAGNGGGGGFGFGAGLADGAGAKDEPGLVVEDVEGNQSVVTSVRHIGSKTFFFKGRRWVESTITPEEDARATVIAQFSDDFFALARSQKAECNLYLTFREPVTVKLEGRVYRFDPANP